MTRRNSKNTTAKSSNFPSTRGTTTSCSPSNQSQLLPPCSECNWYNYVDGHATVVLSVADGYKGSNSLLISFRSSLVCWAVAVFVSFDLIMMGRGIQPMAECGKSSNEWSVDSNKFICSFCHQPFVRGLTDWVV